MVRGQMRKKYQKIKKSLKKGIDKVKRRWYNIKAVAEKTAQIPRGIW